MQLHKKYGVFAPETSPWRTIRDTLIDIPDPSESHNIPDHIFREGALTYPGHTGSDIDQPSKTIKAGNHGVLGGKT